MSDDYGIIDIEDGWSQIHERAISVLEAYLVRGVLPKDAPTSADGGGFQGVLFSRADYSHLYKTVYDMCVQRSPHNHSRELYKRYGDAIQTFCIDKIIPDLKDKESDALLVDMYEWWCKHKIYVRWLSRFFSYLDRYYVKVSDVHTVEHEGFSIIFSTVFDAVKDKLAKAIIEQITRERCGTTVDRELLRNVVGIYNHFECVAPDVYLNELEMHVLESTKRHYEHVCEGWLQKATFSEYLLEVEQSLEKERGRCDVYLNSSTADKCELIIVKVLLEDKLKVLLNKETAVQHLLQYEKRQDLKRTFVLLSKVTNGLNELATIFRTFVTAKGNELIAEREQMLASQQTARTDISDPSFVQKLIDLHDNYKSIVVECFAYDFTVNKGLKEAFEVFLNRDVGKHSLSQLMVSFCDRVLKKSGEKLSEDNIENLLTKVVELFGFLSDKDMFSDIYKTMLAKRLLYETSASEDAEKFMIAQLKMRCGQQFTSKLEGMVNDLGVAAELQRTFNDYLKKQPDRKALTCGIDFNAQVLTTGNWPTYATQEVSLCPEMERCLITFNDFYRANELYKSRRITWVHSFGSTTVQASFARKYDLLCNTYQCCLLLLFNNATTLPFNVLRDSLRLDDSLVRKLLGSFFMRRHQILQKVKKDNTSDKGVRNDDEFEVNHAFSSQLRRIKIPTPLQEEVHNKERVEEDRSHAIQAAVVRVMKMRKELKHTQLVAEVVAQLQFFQPTTKAIKINIEQLIQRDFLERDSTTSDLYRYVA